jgi:hypothetical protein
MLLALVGLSLAAQTASKGAPPPAMQVNSSLNQLMRGVIYPASNVVFSSQNDNPSDAKRAPSQDPSLATDPLVSTFGGWVAVENAALALSESANLLLIPGRTCSNGVPAPIDNPDWAKFVQELRDAGMKAYTAAQTKNQDKMIEASDTLNEACADCHKKWRERRAGERCK